MARPLTPRQEQVVRLIAKGLTYAQIADALGIAYQTVRGHVRDLADQLPDDGSPRYGRVRRWACHRTRKAS